MVTLADDPSDTTTPAVNNETASPKGADTGDPSDITTSDPTPVSTATAPPSSVGGYIDAASPTDDATSSTMNTMHNTGFIGGFLSSAVIIIGTALM